MWLLGRAQGNPGVLYTMVSRRVESLQHRSHPCLLLSGDDMDVRELSAVPGILNRDPVRGSACSKESLLFWIYKLLGGGGGEHLVSRKALGNFLPVTLPGYFSVLLQKAAQCGDKRMDLELESGCVLAGPFQLDDLGLVTYGASFSYLC